MAENDIKSEVMSNFNGESNKCGQQGDYSVKDAHGGRVVRRHYKCTQIGTLEASPAERAQTIYY